MAMQPTAARNNRLRDNVRWGYTGEAEEDQVPVEVESRGSNWALWLAVVALVAIALVMLVGPNL
ncbi:MAG: hypothetical protein QM692_17240 [Thermomicrobiales bacterium]